MFKIRSMVVALLVVAGAAGVAEAQARDGSARERARGEGKRGKGQMGQRGMRGLLRGIELSQAERTQVEAVGQRYRAQFQSIRESMQPDLKAARDARQRGDTAAARAAFARTADERARLQTLMERMQGDVRTALAPEHRARFDANVTRMKERMANRRDSDGWRGRGGRRGGNRARSA